MYVCLAAQDNARSLFPADSDPWGHPSLSPQALSRSLRDHPGLALSLSRVERGGAQTPGGGGARTLAQSAHGGQTFLTLLRLTRSRDQAGPAVYCHRVSEARHADIWLRGLPEPTEKAT